MGNLLPGGEWVTGESWFSLKRSDVSFSAGSQLRGMEVPSCHLLDGRMISSSKVLRHVGLFQIFNWT